MESSGRAGSGVQGERTCFFGLVLRRFQGGSGHGKGFLICIQGCRQQVVHLKAGREALKLQGGLPGGTWFHGWALPPELSVEGLSSPFTWRR